MGGAAVAVVKVLAWGLGCAVLFFCLTSVCAPMLEKDSGPRAKYVAYTICLAGLVLGGIAGAAQAVVDAVKQSRQPPPAPDPKTQPREF